MKMRGSNGPVRQRIEQQRALLERTSELLERFADEMDDVPLGEAALPLGEQEFNALKKYARQTRRLQNSAGSLLHSAQERFEDHND